MSHDNPYRNFTRRMEREARHNTRGMEERSKTLTGFEFINSIQIYFYGKGGIEKPQKDIIVHFELKDGVLVKDFEDCLKEKLKGVIVNNGVI